MKLTRILKIVTVNLILFAVLLATVNAVCGRYLQKAARGSRDQLPNYDRERDHAKAVFADYNSIQHRYEPFVGWKTLPYTGKTLHISEEGRRIHTAPAQAGTPEKAAWFFGGSTMWGEGSDDDHTIPASFNKLHPEYQVYNHAQLAYNSRQELDALISLYTTGKKADLVVFYDGANDAAFLCPKEIGQLPAHRLVPMFREKLYVGKSAFARELIKKIFYENILKAIHLYTYTPAPGSSPYDCVSNPEKAEQIADMMIRNWELAHEMVTLRGGKFLAILQPIAFAGHPLTNHLTLDEELGKNCQAVYEQIKLKLAARKHDWAVDLSNLYDGNEYIYIDFCHVSPNGNKKMAAAISNTLSGTLPASRVTLSTSR